MEFVLRYMRTSSTVGWLYAASVLMGFHFATLEYVHSSFLLTLMSRDGVGIFIAAGSILAIIGLGSIAAFLKRFGVYKTVLAVAVIDFAATLSLATFEQPGILVVAFCLYITTFPLILLCLDVFLEERGQAMDHEGSVRSGYLSVGMFAAMLSPMLAGFLIGETSDYSTVYLASSLFLIPLFIIIATRFRSVIDPPYQLFSPLVTLRSIARDSNLLSIASAQFLMRFFFSWMGVYLPIYLHAHLGFTWPEIGFMLFVMLTPYALVEVPAGIIADRYLGEKELLATGFVLVACATAILPLGTAGSIAFFATALFVTRVGTALIESMSESYFFKKVDGDDTDLISVFRMLRPLAYVIGPLSATALLYVLPLQFLWIVLAFVMLTGTLCSYWLVDTK